MRRKKRLHHARWNIAITINKVESRYSFLHENKVVPDFVKSVRKNRVK